MPYQNKALRRVAGGLIGFFSGRNNDLIGYWALGLLYRDAPPDRRVRLDQQRARHPGTAAAIRTSWPAAACAGQCHRRRRRP